MQKDILIEPIQLLNISIEILNTVHRASGFHCFSDITFPETGYTVTLAFLIATGECVTATAEVERLDFNIDHFLRIKEVVVVKDGEHMRENLSARDTGFLHGLAMSSIFSLNFERKK
jgi:hypothetical protein